MRTEWGARVSRYAERAASQMVRLAETLVKTVAPGTGESILDVATEPGVVVVEAAREDQPEVERHPRERVRRVGSDEGEDGRGI